MLLTCSITSRLTCHRVDSNHQLAGLRVLVSWPSWPPYCAITSPCRLLIRRISKTWNVASHCMIEFVCNWLFLRFLLEVSSTRCRCVIVVLTSGHCRGVVWFPSTADYRVMTFDPYAHTREDSFCPPAKTGPLSFHFPLFQAALSLRLVRAPVTSAIVLGLSIAVALLRTDYQPSPRNAQK